MPRNVNPAHEIELISDGKTLLLSEQQIDNLSHINSQWVVANEYIERREYVEIADVDTADDHAVYTMFLFRCKRSNQCYRFASSDTIFESEDLRSCISSVYDIPPVFWSESCQKSNGFFGCQDIANEDGLLKSQGSKNATLSCLLS